VSMINRKILKSEADEAAFGRGEYYFDRGHIGALHPQQHGMKAKVFGSRQYQVRLGWADGLESGWGRRELLSYFSCNPSLV